MRSGYPLLLDLSNRLIVIVGGGAVAARKAAGVLAAGATCVRVVAPELTVALPESVQHIAEPYQSRHLNGAGLVFAATDQPDVNAAVVRDAHAAGLLVNRADSGEDESDAGDFTVPALHRRGNVTVAVSIGGAPALAAKIRDQLATALDDRWIKLADATESLRPWIIARVSDLDRRRAALRDLASDEAANLTLSGDAVLRDWLIARYPELR